MCPRVYQFAHSRVERISQSLTGAADGGGLTCIQDQNSFCLYGFLFGLTEFYCNYADLDTLTILSQIKPFFVDLGMLVGENNTPIILCHHWRSIMAVRDDIALF